MAEGKVKKLRILNWKIQTQIAGWAFVSLPILGFLLFQAVPLFFSLFVSFTQSDFFTGEFTWVGFENYAKLFTVPQRYIDRLENPNFLGVLGLFFEKVDIGIALYHFTYGLDENVQLTSANPGLPAPDGVEYVATLIAK